MRHKKRRKEKDWETSSYTQPNDNCVEVHRSFEMVRDSKNPNGDVLHFTAMGFAVFAAAARDGHFG